MTQISSQLSPAAELLRDLIRCPSVTPVEGGALDVLQVVLHRREALAPDEVVDRLFERDAAFMGDQLAPKSPHSDEAIRANYKKLPTLELLTITDEAAERMRNARAQAETDHPFRLIAQISENTFFTGMPM